MIGRRPLEKESVGHWTSARVKAGEYFDGWIAGPMVGVEIHNASVSKPCLKLYCGHLAECPGCKAGLKTGWIGYLPIYRSSDLRPVVVVTRADMLEVIESLEHLAGVRIGRNEGKSEPVWVRANPGLARFTSAMAYKMKPQSCTDWLPILWRYRELISAEQIERGPSMHFNPKTQPVPRVEPNRSAVVMPEPDDAAIRSLKARIAASKENIESNAVDVVVNRIAGERFAISALPKNGKPKK